MRDAEYAATKLAGILASREIKRTAAVQANKSAARADPVAAPAPAAKVLLKEKPMLRLPAFRRAAQ